jgi:3'-phosphoadenosine 5'-phosphosulfate sulfotransferase (PAPS reductase)/FAD synthetase
MLCKNPFCTEELTRPANIKAGLCPMCIGEKETIVVWFSCGAASAVAAKKTIEKYGDYFNIRVVNNPVKEEHEDNFRFLKDVEKWLGVDIEFATNPKFESNSCQEVWNSRKYMSGPSGAPCTFELKKKARQLWEKENDFSYLVLGFTADEKKRHDRFKKNERENILPVLIDEKITKDDCFKIVMDANIELPYIYKMGYPNANCIGCVKASSSTYWNHVRKMHPDVFKERAEFSRKIGCKLAWYKGGRVYLDELPENAKGRSMKGLNFECGIFCEEKT